MQPVTGTISETFHMLLLGRDKDSHNGALRYIPENLFSIRQINASKEGWFSYEDEIIRVTPKFYLIDGHYIFFQQDTFSIYKQCQL
jgi:hypothetical protein